MAKAPSTENILDLSLFWSLRPDGAIEVVVRGAVTEKLDASRELRREADLFLGNASGLPVFLDVGGVNRINSVGVRNWTLFLLSRIQSSHRLHFSILSEAFIEAASIIPALLGTPQADIEAFQIPFECRKCRSRFIVTGLASEVTAEATWRPFKPVSCPSCKAGSVAADVLEDEYFFFLKKMRARA